MRSYDYALDLGALGCVDVRVEYRVFDKSFNVALKHVWLTIREERLDILENLSEFAREELEDLALENEGWR